MCRHLHYHKSRWDKKPQSSGHLSLSCSGIACLGDYLCFWVRTLQYFVRFFMALWIFTMFIRHTRHNNWALEIKCYKLSAPTAILYVQLSIDQSILSSQLLTLNKSRYSYDKQLLYIHPPQQFTLTWPLTWGGLVLLRCAIITSVAGCARFYASTLIVIRTKHGDQVLGVDRWGR